MKKMLSLSAVLAFGLALGFASFSAGADADGKTLFLGNKCNLCHSISSQGITKTSEKMKGEDLSTAGSVVEGAEWLKGWLLQLKDKAGAKHSKKFKGTDAELDTLVNWIMSLKKS